MTMLSNIFRTVQNKWWFVAVPMVIGVSMLTGCPHDRDDHRRDHDRDHRHDHHQHDRHHDKHHRN